MPKDPISIYPRKLDSGHMPIIEETDELLLKIRADAKEMKKRILVPFMEQKLLESFNVFEESDLKIKMVTVDRVDGKLSKVNLITEE